MTKQLRLILDGNDAVQEFDRTIAEQAKYHGYERYYKLTKAQNEIVFRSPNITVYGYEDSCFLLPDESDYTAFAVNQFDVHALVREIINKTDYVLSYYEESVLSESQWEILFEGVRDYPGESNE